MKIDGPVQDFYRQIILVCHAPPHGLSLFKFIPVMFTRAIQGRVLLPLSCLMLCFCQSGLPEDVNVTVTGPPEPPPIGPSHVADTVLKYIKEQISISPDGKFHLRDPKTDRDLVLKYFKVHRWQIRRVKESEYYDSVLFKNENNEIIEVDFIVIGKDSGKLSIAGAETSIRKIGNENRYEWKKLNNHIWVREYPPENKSGTTSNQPKLLESQSAVPKGSAKTAKDGSTSLQDLAEEIKGTVGAQASGGSSKIKNDPISNEVKQSSATNVTTVPFPVQ